MTDENQIWTTEEIKKKYADYDFPLQRWITFEEHKRKISQTVDEYLTEIDIIRKRYQKKIRKLKR